MMKKRITLIFLIFFNFLTLWGENDKPKLLEEASSEAACSCNCDKDRDLAVLTELYNNNGGANWNFQANVGYQDILNNDGNSGYFDVPNAGVAWDINAPNAKNFMGNWHGVKTNQQKCITELILWSGAYNTEQFNQSEGIGLTGALPASLNQLCALEKLMIPHNDLTGAIPAGLDSLCNLEVLLLHDNQLEGPLPSEIGDLTNLEHLSLHNNAFTGSLPATYTNLTELAIFHAENNKLTGPIPVDIGNLTKLFILNLSDNCLSGIVPSSIVSLGSNSFINGFPVGDIQTLLLNNNKLDSLPNIAAISLINGATFDISGNHFTFDDIIPNISVLTEYADQTLVLDTIFCISPSDVGIRLQGGFDESVDAFVYGDSSIYVWTRAEDAFTITGGQNFLFFPEITANSASNFSISVTNVQAPDLTLKVSNFIVKVPIPNSDGPVVVCANTTTPYYVEDAEQFDWTVSNGGTFLAIGDSLYITWGTGSSATVTATGRAECSTTTFFNITILPAFTLNINPPEKLSCNRTSTILKGTSSDPSTFFSWQNEQGDTLGISDTLVVTTPGIYILVGQNANSCEARDTVLVEEEDAIITSLDLIDGEAAICDTDVAYLSISVDTFISYRWNTNNPADTSSFFFPLPPAAGIYAVTATAANGCVAIDSVEIVALPNPAIDLTQNGVLGCDSSSVTLVNTLADNGEIFQWKDATGAIIGTDTFITVNTSGIYSLTARNGSDCIHTDTIRVMQETTDYVVNAGADQVLTCTTKNLSLDASNTVDAVSYQWFDENFVLISTSASVNVTDSGNYTVEVTNSKGCTATDEVLVTDSSYTLTPMLTGPPTFCEGTASTLSLTDTYATYQWSNGDTLQTIQISTGGIYAVTVSDVNACTGSNSVEVREFRSPIVSLFQSGVLDCNSSEIEVANGFTGTNQTFEWSDATGIIGSGVFIPVTNPGVYTLTIRNEFGCTQTDSIEVIADTSLPIANAGSNQVLTCANNQVVLDGSNSIDAASYSWLDENAVQLGTSATLSVSQAGIYTLAIKNANGCMTTDEVEVVDNTSAFIPEFVGGTTFCAGTTNFLNLTETYSQYQWSTGETTPTIQVDTAGIYTVNVVDQNGCTGANDITINIAPSPSFEFTGEEVICKEGMATLGIDSTFAMYTWSTGSALQTTTIDTAGLYSVTVTDANACRTIASTFIAEVPKFTVQIAGDRIVCEGASTTLNATSSDPNVSYEWSTGSSFFIVGIDNPGTYTLTVTDDNGCTSQDSIEITTYRPPPITFSNDGISLCTGGTANISVVESYADYEWSTGDSTQTITVMGEGSYAVTVIDGKGCQNNVSNIIVESSGPSLPNGVEDSICVGGTTILEAPTGFNDYEWSTGEQGDSIEVEEAMNYQVTVTDNNNCSASMNIRVREITLPAPDILGSRLLCEGSNTQLTTANSFATYQWSTGDTTASIAVEEMGIYSVTVSGGSNGCTAISEPFIVERATDIDFDIIGNTAICAGASTTLRADDDYVKYAWSTGDTTATISVNAVDTYSLVVTNSAGCTGEGFLRVEERSIILPQITGQKVICKDGTTEISADSDYASYLWSTGETTKSILVDSVDVYTLQVTNETGCEGNTSQLIKEDTNINAQIIGGTSFCEGTTTLLGVDDTYRNYIWSTGDTTATIAMDTSGVITVTVTNENGCVGQTMAIIESQALPQPVIIGKSILCEGEVANLEVASNFVSYEWDTGDIEDTLSTLFLFDALGTHSVVVTDINGCTGSTSIDISRATIIDIEESRDICGGGTILLDLEAAYDNYQWSTGDTSATIRVDTSGEYTLAVTDTSGCTGTAKFIVSELESPDLLIDYASDTKCFEGPTVLFADEVTVGPNYQYNWLKNGNQVNNSAFIAIETHGVYTLVLEDKSTGCSTSEEIEIFENDIQLNVGEPSRVLNCNNNIALIDARSSMNANHFYWEREDLDNPNITEILENEADTLNVIQAGRYMVIGIDTLSGCKATTFVEVRDSIEPLQLSISGDRTICAGMPIDVAVNVQEAGNENYQYNWSTNSDKATAQIDFSGIYYVTVTDENACIGMDSIQITNQEKVFLEARLTSDETEICAGEEVELNFLIDGKGVGPYKFRYTDGEGDSIWINLESNSIDIKTNPKAGKSYQLLEVVDEGNNCYGTDSVDITPFTFTVLESPAVVKGMYKNCMEDTGDTSFNLENLEDDINGDTRNRVKWYSTDDTTAIAIESNTPYSISETTEIYASVKDDNNGCESSRVPITLEVEDCSTNIEKVLGAGDELDLSTYKGESGASLEVYITNRWGDLVYVADDYGPDNKFNGEGLPQGAYYIYMKKTKNEGIFVPYKGIIYLLK